MNSNSTTISAGLALINGYSSEEDESSDEVKPDLTKTEKLPLPATLFNRISPNAEEYSDDTSTHDGRIRSFPHQRGNWATYIFIPFSANELYKTFINLMIADLDQSIGLKAVEDPHISLTKTVVLLHHWIDSFIQSVEHGIKHVASFAILFDSVSVYTNKEKTRTFVGLDVTRGYQELMYIVNILNACLKEFNLDTFYEVPSFHMSFAWCLGDKKEIIENLLPDLQVRFHQFVSSNSEFRYLNVCNCCCKTGNKFFNFKLKSL